MNNWGNDFGMQNQYCMPPMASHMPNMMHNMVPPLVPPMCMVSEMGHPNPAPTPGPLIGPVIPVDNNSLNSNENDVQIMEDVSEVKDDRPSENNTSSSQERRNEQTRSNNNNRDNRRDRNFDRDRNRRRSRSRDRFNRNDRNRDQGHNDRNSNDRRNDRRRERPSKWNKEGDDNPMNNMQMMPGMMPMMMNNNLMNNMMPQQPMEMGGNMQNMGNMGNMMAPGMNMMAPGMNMMAPGMMDPNMIMMNQQQMNQPIYFSSGVLLPSLPGTSMPSRREKPPGCRTVFVGGLPNIINEDVVTEIFQRFGPITSVKLHRQGVCHVRFDNHSSVEQSFMVSGFRFKLHDQTENEATTIFVDYALNRDDQNEFERNKRHRPKTPPRIEPFNPNALTTVIEKMKNDDEFGDVASTLYGWLERGECNKKYANTFYSLIQAANNHVRRLFNDKMQLDEEFQTVKNDVKEKYMKIISQFEQVAKILTAAKHQRVSDHFTKQQRRNIEMWLKMTEEVDNIKEEYNLYFEEDENETRGGKNSIPLEKYEELKTEHENLMYELEGYRNEAHLAKDEAERKFEKFKAQFIAQQALQNPRQQVYPPLPPPPMPVIIDQGPPKPEPPPPTPDDMKLMKSGQLSSSDAKLISVLTAFLLVHPLGVNVDNIVAYIKSMIPGINHNNVNTVLQRYPDIFHRKTTGYGNNTAHKWEYVTFEAIKNN